MSAPLILPTVTMTLCAMRPAVSSASGASPPKDPAAVPALGAIYHAPLVLATGALTVYLFGNAFSIYTGVIPNANPGIGDITFIVGFILTAILYYAFSMVGRTAPSRAGMAGPRAG